MNPTYGFSLISSLELPAVETLEYIADKYTY